MTEESRDVTEEFPKRCRVSGERHFWSIPTSVGIVECLWCRARVDAWEAS